LPQPTQSALSFPETSTGPHILISRTDGDSRWQRSCDAVSDPQFSPGQRNSTLRALAPVLWAQDANRDQELGERLARDPSVLARQTLASEIASSGQIHPDNPVVVRLAADDHYSVRKALQGREY